MMGASYPTKKLVHWWRLLSTDKPLKQPAHCTCENNGDYCAHCQDKEERGIVARDIRLEKKQEREEYRESL